jgi:D-aspartate ligase
MEGCRALVAELGYTGLGEVDVKRDPTTGGWLFFELNPRAGRNSYYMAAAGVNPMRAAVADLVDGRGEGLQVADGPALYTLVPLSLLERYLTDPDLLADVRGLVAAGRVFDPQRYAPDMGLRRRLDVELTERNQVRKFARYYPRPTDTSF